MVDAGPGRRAEGDRCAARLDDVEQGREHVRARAVDDDVRAASAQRLHLFAPRVAGVVHAAVAPELAGAGKLGVVLEVTMTRAPTWRAISQRERGRPPADAR